jgi:hypothetical protein
MRRIEVAEADSTEFLRINTQLADGKKLSSEGKKKTDASKAFLADWLKKHRDIDVGTLETGELVVIQIPGKDGMRDCFRIEIRSSGERLDLDKLKNEQAEIVARYTGPSAAIYYNAVPQS